MSTTDGAAIGLAFPDIVLPVPSVDMERWSVIACDQFTADRSYWDEVEAFVGDNPSTFHMIVPEVYLGDGDLDERRAKIEATMRRYQADGTLRTLERSAVYVRRTLRSGAVRRGIVIAVDLEEYDYSPDSSSAIRASEETIPARLPARVDVRRDAILESPHVLVLYDDGQSSVTERIEGQLQSLERVYETSLMQGGGQVEGYRLPEGSPVSAQLIEDLSRLDTPDRYGFRFATGDGNHSLAAARALWIELRDKGVELDDPRRWCLVELVNVYDEGLPFHPIHRLVSADESSVLDALLKRGDARFHGFPVDRIAGHVAYEGLAAHEIAFIGPEQAGILTLPEDSELPVAIADAAIADVDPAEVDYIHGFEEVVTAAERTGSIAVVLPEIDRHRLFATVSEEGALPRKAFSLGEAQDKRYYLECRTIGTA